MEQVYIAPGDPGANIVIEQVYIADLVFLLGCPLGNLASMGHLSSWDWICSRGTMELWAPLGQVVGDRSGAGWGISAPSETAERLKLSGHSGPVNTIESRDCLIFVSLRRILRL